jgi:hypothetical protein
LGAFSPQAPDERTRARPRTQTRASRGFVKVKTLKLPDTKKQRFFLKPQRGFRLKFFERFGKLFYKKFFQGFDLALALLKPQRGFRIKFFERFGKLFFKKVFQGFDLALLSLG